MTLDPTHEMTVTVEAVDDHYAEMLREFLIDVTAGGEFAVGELRSLRPPHAPHGDPEFMPHQPKQAELPDVDNEGHRIHHA